MKRALVLWALLCGAAQAQIGPTLGSPTGPGISSTLPSAFGTPGTPPTPRADFYVDSVGGSDANDCSTYALRCQTIAKLLSVSPPANSDIYLERGSYWREMLYPAGIGAAGGLLNGSQVLARGAGARPIFDGADVIPAGTWSKTAGRSFVYQANVTHPAAWSAFRAGQGNRIWDNGTRLTYVADVATCDSTPGSWTGPTRPTAGPDTIYVHASDNTDPATNGRTYTWPARPYGLHAGQYSTETNRIPVVIGVEVRNFGHHDGGLLTAGYLSDFLILSGGYGPVDPLHALWCNGTCENGTFSDVVSYGNNLPATTIRNVTVNCDGASASNMSGLFFHSGALGSFKHEKKTYENVTVTGCYSAFGGNAAKQVLINGLTLTGNNVRQVLNLSYVDRLDVLGVTWVRNTASDDGNAIIVDNVPSMTICGGRFVTNRAASYALLLAGTSNNSSMTVTGNSFVFTSGPPSMGAAYRNVAANRTSGGSLSLTRNLIYYTGNPVYLPSSTSMTSDYNLVESGANAPTGWNVNGTTYATWALWRAAGYDANSVAEAITFAGDPTLGNTLTSGGSASTLPAGADAYGDTYCAAYALTIP